jgi:pimeloyl-ACP methyl ester carboxylesterase
VSLDEMTDHVNASTVVPADPLTSGRDVSWAFLPGAGGGSTLWEPVARRFGGKVLTLPAVDSVPAMVDAVEATVRMMPGRRILVGNSLGAMVALELSQRVPVAGLMLVAAGWEFPVSEELIRRVETRGHLAFAESARRCVSPGAPPEQLAAVIEDFESRAAGTMAAHLRAIRDYEPRIDRATPLPVTLVLRGGHDRSVTLRDHLELAERTGGALIPLGSAAHMPFVDHGDEVAAWLERLRAFVEAR